MKSPVQYCLVRKDLPVYIQMVQACHACGEAILEAPISSATILRLLHVANEVELLEFAEKLKAKNYHIALIREPDEPWNGAAMALATEPATERISGLTKLFYHLPKAQ